MYNHAPENYKCPFCRIVKGIEGGNIATKQADIFYRDKYITAFVSSLRWPNNKGNIIIIPNKHVENIYTLPDKLSDKIHAFEKKVSLAIKKLYKCDGVSSRQHNGPEANQTVWHYHLHVFPRYKNDNLYQSNDLYQESTQRERVPFATKLRKYFEEI